MNKNLLDGLCSSGFFADIAEEHLESLAEICRDVDFPARHTIFEEHEIAKAVYVILKGEISLAVCDHSNSCRQIASVRAGELMGWSPLVGRARLYDTARTVTPVKTLRFDGAKLMHFC